MEPAEQIKKLQTENTQLKKTIKELQKELTELKRYVGGV